VGNRLRTIGDSVHLQRIEEHFDYQRNSKIDDSYFVVIR